MSWPESDVVRQTKQCAWCAKTPLKKIEIGLSKKLLDFNPPLLLCLACLAQELESDEEELKLWAQRFRAEGCEFFQ